MLRKLVLSIIVALGGAAPYNLVALEEAYDWSSGSRGPRIGTYYVVLRRADMEKQRVFIREPAPVVDANIVAQQAAEMRFIQVDFDGFTASVSADKTCNLRIYAEAQGIRIIQPQTSGKKES